MRTPVSHTTSATTATASIWKAHVCASVPAVSAWIVERRNNGKLAKCVARQNRFGNFVLAREVSSTAIKRYSAVTPHATATGCHLLANGTSTDASPK